MSKLIIKKCDSCDCSGHKGCFPLCFPLCFTGSNRLIAKAINRAKQILTSNNTSNQLYKSENRTKQILTSKNTNKQLHKSENR